MSEYAYEQRLFGGQDLGLSDYRLRFCLRQIGDDSDRVLVDVGSGAGTRTRLIAQARPGLTCIGVEFSRRSIKAGLDIQDDGILFIRGSAEAIPVRDSSADYVVGFDVFEHLHDPEAALAECHRILRPGGILHAFIPCEGEKLTIYPWAPLVRNLKQRHVGHVQYFRKKDLRETLQRMGLSTIDEKHSYFYISQFGDALRQFAKVMRTECTQSGFQIGNIRSRPLALMVRAYRSVIHVLSLADLGLSRLLPQCTAGYHLTARRVD